MNYKARLLNPKGDLPKVFEDLAQPGLTAGAITVWKRNFKYFLQQWYLSLMWILVEPLLYLGAIGFGVGRFVGQINGLSYLDFFYPALLATTAMFVPFFEATYGSFTKLTHQKTYSTIMLAPIRPGEIVSGEILWAATKGFFSVIGVLLVAAFLGLTPGLLMIPALVLLALTCWIFAALGMLFCSFARNYDSFIYSTSGFVIPMSLFSGTYFPLNEFPGWLSKLAYLLPLTHAVRPIRGLMSGMWEYDMLLNILVLVIIAPWISVWASYRISKKLYL